MGLDTNYRIFSELDGYINVMYKTVAVYRIPKEIYFLADSGADMPRAVECNLNRSSAAEKLLDTCCEYAENKIKCHVFKNSKDEDVFVDAKLLKMFGSYAECHQTAFDTRSPVYVYDDCKGLLGLIMPINMKRGKKND